MYPYLFKRLRRRPWLSLCALILSGVLCFLLTSLTDYRQEQETKLQDTKDSFDILCVVTNKQGTRSTSLELGPEVAEFVLSEENGMGEYVRDPRITKELIYAAPDLAFGFYTSDRPLIGVTNPRCATVLDVSTGGSVTYFRDDFYESSENLCLVSQMVYEQYGRDTISLRITDPHSNLSWSDPDDPTNRTLEFTIAGWYTGGGPEIYIPYPVSQTLAQAISGEATTDSISFLAADNEALDAMTEAASEIFTSLDPTAHVSSLTKAALTVHDQQYRATVAALEQNITRTSYLLPLVMLLGLALGFLVSFLATRSERLSYALMRTLGLTRGKLFCSILLEQTLLPMAAVAVIGIAMRNPAPALGYLVCHCIGCAIASVRAVAQRPTAILRNQE